MKNEMNLIHQPIDMILHCPNCHTQHIDAPEPDICECGCVKQNHRFSGDVGDLWCSLCGVGCIQFKVAWDNPPHKSHLCHNCKTVWRPADIPTNGVAEIKTRGSNDNYWEGVK